MQRHQIVTELKHLLAEVPRRISAFPEPEMMDKPDPVRWSKQEILGHLADSALHNWQRFANVQFAPQPFRYEPYDQDNLVRVNGYNALPRAELLTLWEALNRQIIRVLEKVPEAALDYVAVHAGSGQSYTVRELAEDYVAHLKHHLQQIFQPNAHP
ncbi:MAG: DinB family protein [Cytophagales bacterium]|nr:DinB family protein [Cytophagales bacterium]